MTQPDQILGEVHERQDTEFEEPAECLQGGVELIDAVAQRAAKRTVQQRAQQAGGGCRRGGGLIMRALRGEIDGVVGGAVVGVGRGDVIDPDRIVDIDVHLYIHIDVDCIDAGECSAFRLSRCRVIDTCGQRLAPPSMRSRLLPGKDASLLTRGHPYFWVCAF